MCAKKKGTGLKVHRKDLERTNKKYPEKESKRLGMAKKRLNVSKRTKILSMLSRG